jgi:hypothetical protein
VIGAKERVIVVGNSEFTNVTLMMAISTFFFSSYVVLSV